MNNEVYVAYKHYFTGSTRIIGVYRDPDDAHKACIDAEKEDFCDWAEYDLFEVR